MWAMCLQLQSQKFCWMKPSKYTQKLIHLPVQIFPLPSRVDYVMLTTKTLTHVSVLCCGERASEIMGENNKNQVIYDRIAFMGRQP